MSDEFARAEASLLATIEATMAQNGATALTTPQTDISTAIYPDFPSPSYERMRPWWELCRALMAGTDAVRAGATVYLPRLAAESDEAYTFRSRLCALFPGFARTVKASVGLINQTAPILGEDMPQALVDLAENIDRQGTNITVFAKALTKDGIVDGFAGILVDYPRADDPSLDRRRASAAAVPGAALSGDDTARLGLRPYWVLVRADEVIKAMYQTREGVRTLVLLVIREVSETLDDTLGAFGTVTLTRYRVYRLTPTGVTYQLWEKKYSEAYSSAVDVPKPMTNVTAIPWSPFVAGEKQQDPTTVRPPLMDLAYLNVEHYQIKTNIRNLETLALVPTQVRIGATRDEDGNYPSITLGPRSTIEAPVIQGVSQPVYWHSPDVSVLAPGNESLKNTEAAMGSAGLSFLAPDSRAAETAAAKRIDSTAQNATITTVAGALQDCLETAFGFTGQYLNLKAGSVTVNTDYENTVMTAQMVAALGQLAVNGQLDIMTLLDLLEDGHILPDGTDKDAIMKRILAQNAPPPVDPNAPPLPDNAPPGGKRPTKATVTDTTTGKQHTIVTE